MAHVQSNGAGHGPPRNGRRLIQMLFRANQDEEARDSRWEDHRLTGDPLHGQSSSHPSQSRSERPEGLTSIDSAATIRPPNGKFSALKRKLFPSMQRRAPLRVPALLPLSPIDASTVFSPTQSKSKQPEHEAGRIENSIDVVLGFGQPDIGDNNTPVDQFAEWSNIDTSHKLQQQMEDSMRCEPAASARPDYESDDEDRDLELAVEVVDFESSNAEETLIEMTRAIEQIHEWKRQHEQRAQLLKEQMEQEATKVTARLSANAKDDEDDIEKAVASFRDEQKRLQYTFNQDCIEEFTQQPISPLCPALGEAEETRIAAALHIDEACTEGLAVARLRDELFHLEVRERNAAMQAVLLQDLEGADAALDLKIVDVEAFTSALDSVLAQFDVPSSIHPDSASLDC